MKAEAGASLIQASVGPETKGGNAKQESRMEAKRSAN